MIPAGAVPGPLRRPIALLALLLSAMTPAHAHRSTTGPTDGISIPSVSHGQMAVIDQNRAAVLTLAAKAIATDEPFRRLLNYAKIQHTVCLWGLVPGSIDDEQSPFNECAHAYLAATRALLNDMRDRGTDPAARALADKVDHELLLDGTLLLCAYSGDPYNTADVIYPNWSAVSEHRPTALAGGGMLAIVAAGTLLAWRRRARVSAPG
jgi:hypothetical protein